MNPSLSNFIYLSLWFSNAQISSRSTNYSGFSKPVNSPAVYSRHLHLHCVFLILLLLLYLLQHRQIFIPTSIPTFPFSITGYPYQFLGISQILHCTHVAVYVTQPGSFPFLPFNLWVSWSSEV